MSDSSSLNRPRLWRRLVPGPAALMALLLGLSLAIAPMDAYDVFFNVASGRWIRLHGLPTVDPFSSMATGTWFPHEWLFSVLASYAVSWFGARGPGLLGGVLLAATILILGGLIRGTLRRSRPIALPGQRRAGGEPLAQASNAAWSVLLLLLMLLGQWHGLYEVRGFYAGNLLFALALWLVLRWRHGAAGWAFLGLPLVALWANLHGSWPLFPVLLLGTVLGRALDRVLAWRERERLAPSEVGRAGSLFKVLVDRKARLGVLAALLSLPCAAFSPEGFATVGYPFMFSQGISAFGINEWAPMPLTDRAAAAFFALLLLLLGGGLLRLAQAKRDSEAAGEERNPSLACGPSATLHLASTLPALVLSLLALRHGRHVLLAVMLLAPAAAEQLPRCWPAGLPQPLREALMRIAVWLQAWSRQGGVLLVVLAFLGVGLGAAMDPPPLWRLPIPGTQPVAAVRALALQPPGKVLNRYRFGGLISAIAGPEYKVYIDGRTDAYAPRHFAAYHRIKALAPGWQADLAAYDPDYLVWSTRDGGAGLLEALRRRGGWQSLVETPGGVLWKRRR